MPKQETGTELCSFHGHKNTVVCVKWNQNGNWVLTASKDQRIKLYDIRAMKELEPFRGHRKDVTDIIDNGLDKGILNLSWKLSLPHVLVGNISSFKLESILCILISMEIQ
ncbi:hypothetical protein VNO80_21219 [Phaseolus coccineus]|uniref:Anaphase-promoting complex subunit 4 WD40 domain-containing protein n=1 Tax=Phaseolus coccineus TaxID=3886 RepID=A0AAN9M2M9_PHACN